MLQKDECLDSTPLLLVILLLWQGFWRRLDGSSATDIGSSIGIDNAFSIGKIFGIGGIVGIGISWTIKPNVADWNLK